MGDLLYDPDVLTAVGSLLTGAAAIWAAHTARKGLMSWRVQLRGQVDHELAKRSLLAVYKFRDSLYGVRHPAMSNEEMALTHEEVKTIVAGSERSAGVINAYAKRWKRHSGASREMDAVLLEADALWGRDFRNLFGPLKDLEHELFSYISLYIDAHLRGDSELALRRREIIGERRDIIFDYLDDEKDEFRQEFEKALQSLEGYLRSKLRAGS